MPIKWNQCKTICFLAETASAADEIRITDLQKDIQNLYNYNVMLREKLMNAQSMLHVLSEKKKSS